MNIKEILDNILNEEKDFDDYNKKYYFTIQCNEGEIPHIHYFKTSKKNPEREGCIALNYNGYFNHSSKHKPLDNKKVEDWIFNILKNDTNWKKACELWNSMNLYKFISENNPYKYATHFGLETK